MEPRSVLVHHAVVGFDLIPVHDLSPVAGSQAVTAAMRLGA